MDNDLMARRLRPPSQPTPPSGQQPTQPPAPWDVPLASEGQFAPPDVQLPPQDPQFAPPDGLWGPDPQARADVPWDRPDPEPWPPADDDAAAMLPQTWSAIGAAPAAYLPDWPTTDSPAADDPAPWDRPTAHETDQSHDPDDAMAPVVSDVIQAPASAWTGWNGNGHYAAPTAPEPMTVAAQSDGPLDFEEPHSAPWSEPATTPTSGSASVGGSAAGPDPVPDWPAEDDLTVAPPTSHGPVMPEDSWPVTPPVTPPATPPVTPPVIEPAPPEAAVAAEVEPEPEPEPAAPEPEPELIALTPEPEPVALTPEPVVPTPEPEPTTSEPATPAVTAMVMPVGANSQNMVLRIEVAIVDESRRANPAAAAKSVGPDTDVRRPEYEPRNQGGRASMPEPEYLWDMPPQATPQPQPRRPMPPNTQPPAPPRHISAPPSAWQPAAPVPPEPMTMDWDLPVVGASQPMADQPAPWSTPTPTPTPAQPPHQQHMPPPAPTWALTQPTPPYLPPAPQFQLPAPPAYEPPVPPAYQPPVAPQYTPEYPPQVYQAAPPQSFQPAPPLDYQPAPPQDYQPAPPQPAWPPTQLGMQPHDPLADLQAAPYLAPAQYVPPTPYAPVAPAMPTQPQMPVQSLQSAPAASSHARTGQAAANQADLWFLSNQPAATIVEDDDAQPEGRSSSILTAGLTIGFALLVIVLVLVFIQLMTSLLR